MDSSKGELTEQEIRTRYIYPSIQEAGWNKKQIREEYHYTAGEIVVRGNLTVRKKERFVDYLLNYKTNLPLAIIEAKKNSLPVADGIQQAIEYGNHLDVPFVYSSNGDGYLEHDNLTGKEREIRMNEFPSPEELWSRYKNIKNIDDEESKVIQEDYYFDDTSKTPRYYQRVAVNRTVEAVAKGQKRVFLVMATGTGKTYTAFQIIHRLREAGLTKRVLFLVDRTSLANQTMAGDFRAFGDSMVRFDRQNMSKAYEVYIALYQSLSSPDESLNIYKEFSKDFFDLIIVDEAHRGSAREESAWRKILEYFESATQIGLTATPKETKEVSNATYFGEPVYTYSLQQGIKDGFLAPYKVIRIILDRDAEGYRPTEGKLDRYGEEIEDRYYNVSDYDRTLMLGKRHEIVAKKITEYMKNTDRYQKVIMFCEDTEHALSMRQALINENPDLAKENDKYVMRITGNDKRGSREIENFIDPGSEYPVIATTSKLLSTGVDTQTVKLIVLDMNINSIGMFKQMIGRGTRIKEEYGKEFFTIMDFRGATRLFADPEFDGDPIVVYEPSEEDSVIPPEDEVKDEESDLFGESDDKFSDEFREDDADYPTNSDEVFEGVKKFYVDDVEVRVATERVQYYDDGVLKTESLVDYTKKNIKKEYADLNSFIKDWNSADKKSAILDELRSKGVFLDEVRKEMGDSADNLDEFDLILHLAFDQKPLTRQERANNVKKQDYFGKYSDLAIEVLNTLLEKYKDEGIKDIDDIKILSLDEFKEIGTPPVIIKEFGGKGKYLETIKELEKELYA